MNSLWTRASSYNRHTRAHRRLAVLLSIGALALAGCSPVTQVSVSHVPGAEPDGDSDDLKLSDDGRYAVFASEATNLTANDTNAFKDVFLRDNQTGTTELISRTTGGLAGNNLSSQPDVSGDGRYVAYWSFASDLIPVDTNAVSDVFVYDRQTGFTERVSIDSNENQLLGSSLGGSISADGRYVAFISFADDIVAGDSNNTSDLFVHDRQTGNTVLASVASDGSQGVELISSSPSLSADGRYVAFATQSRLVPEDTSIYKWHDIFVRDLQSNTTTRVNVNSNGNGAFKHSYDPVISANGMHVAFMSEAENLVVGDTNEARDIFVHDRALGETTRVSVDSEGNQTAKYLGYSNYPSISADGRYVAFLSHDTNLVNNDFNGQSDIFVHDRNTGVTSRVNLGALGEQANSHSARPYLTADGHYIVFSSYASNLVPNDNNGSHDIFMRSVPTIEIESVIPHQLPIGATTSVTITGKNFLPHSFPFIHGQDDTFSNIVHVDETTFTADVTVHPDAVSGARSVSVHLFGTVKGNISGSAAHCTNCVTFF